MSKNKAIFLQGMSSRNADIDLLVAEHVGAKASLKAEIKALKAEQQTLKRQLDREHQKVTDMQTILDRYMLDYEANLVEKN